MHSRLVLRGTQARAVSDPQRSDHGPWDGATAASRTQEAFPATKGRLASKATRHLPYLRQPPTLPPLTLTVPVLIRRPYRF